MKCIRSSAVAMMGSLLLFSTVLAQVKPSARPPAPKNPRNWTRFTIERDAFGVLMPAYPVVRKEVRVIGGQQLLLSYYGAASGQSDYSVLTLSGFNDANWNVAQMLMLDLYSRSRAASSSQVAQGGGSVKAILQKDISLDGYTGKQFSLETGDQIGEWRIFEVNKAFYAVAASTDARYATSLRRFFDSFSLSENNSIASNATAAVGNRVSNQTSRWLVILQTFSRNEWTKADRRMNYLQNQGYDAQVINTDSYSKLRPGLLALTMGPFSKRTAQERLVALRIVAPQSYIKAGW